jgi:hypothetical protein
MECGGSSVDEEEKRDILSIKDKKGYIIRKGQKGIYIIRKGQKGIYYP